jgi:hypothetical protein
MKFSFSLFFSVQTEKKSVIKKESQEREREIKTNKMSPGMTDNQ